MKGDPSLRSDSDLELMLVSSISSISKTSLWSAKSKTSQTASLIGDLGRHASRLELSTYRFPQTDLLPPSVIRRFSIDPQPELYETYPSWLYPKIDWEKESRWGHFWLKCFALVARLAATFYWLLTGIPAIRNWHVLCLFYHACPGFLGVETSAIIPFGLTPVPYRTLSWFHDISGVILGTACVITVYLTHPQENVILTLMSLTVIPLIVDLIIHVITLPTHVVPAA